MQLKKEALAKLYAAFTLIILLSFHKIGATGKGKRGAPVQNAEEAAGTKKSRISASPAIKPDPADPFAGAEGVTEEMRAAYAARTIDNPHNQKAKYQKAKRDAIRAAQKEVPALPARAAIAAQAYSDRLESAPRKLEL